MVSCREQRRILMCSQNPVNVYLVYLSQVAPSVHAGIFSPIEIMTLSLLKYSRIDLKGWV
jgi:hypothetical protein